MGQRLNIEIKKNGECIANAYYHWSAYTSESVEMLKGIRQFIKDNPSDTKDKLYAIRILESTGAGLTDAKEPTEEEDIEMIKKVYCEEAWDEYLHPISELKEAKKLYPNAEFKKCNGRNNGLLSITKKAIEETEEWEEGRIEIDIDTLDVNFNVLWNTEDYDKEELEKFKCVETDFNFEKFNLLTELDELEKLCVINKENYYNCVFKTKNKKVSFIQ